MSLSKAKTMPEAKDYEDIAARYRRMRKASFQLNKILLDYVSKEGLRETARKLGLWVKGNLVLDDMDEMSVLFDQAIYGHFTDGRNAVDRFVADHPPRAGSDDEAVLAAEKRSYYSLFRVEGVVPELGVHVHDILRDRRHFLADLGFGCTALEGVVLATRVLPFEDFLMTSGAPLMADADTSAKILRLPALAMSLQEIEGTSRQEAADFAAAVIRLCLKGHAIESIAYQRIDKAGPRDRSPLVAEPRVSRNDPCPCGSGRKYKKCCGR